MTDTATAPERLPVEASDDGFNAPEVAALAHHRAAEHKCWLEIRLETLEEAEAEAEALFELAKKVRKRAVQVADRARVHVFAAGQDYDKVVDCMKRAEKMFGRVNEKMQMAAWEQADEATRLADSIEERRA